MPTRPDNLPRWATGGTAEVTEPTAGEKDVGWLGGVKPENETMNWLQKVGYDWLKLFKETVAWFDDLDEAIDELAIGDMCTVAEDDTAVGPGVEQVEKNTAMTPTTKLLGDIDTCGDLVVFGAGADVDPKGVVRDLTGAESGGTPAVTYTLTNGRDQGIYCIKTDGTVTVVAYNDSSDGVTVEGFNAVTGASLWTFDAATTTIWDMALAAGKVVLATHDTSASGDWPAANLHCHALNATTGAHVWSYRHSSAVISTSIAVCTNGRQVFFAGPASAYPSGANLRALRLTDGADVDDEWGGGTAEGGMLTFNKVMPDVAGYGALSCDRRLLYIGKDSGAANQLEARGLGDGQFAWGVPHPAGQNCNSVFADQDYVLTCMSDNGAPAEGYVEAYDRRTGALVWRWAAVDKSATPNPTACVAVASDGAKVYCIAEDDPYIWQISRGNVAHPFVRVDTSAHKDGYRTLKLQPLPR